MGGFTGRRNELEERFFSARDRELIEAMRKEAAAKEKLSALADASGITDENLLKQLDALDMCSETVAALSLVPLIAVAWADGSVAAKERDAVLAAAAQKGLEEGHPGYMLLQRWLVREPDDALLDVWKHYAKALVEKLTDSAKQTLRDELLGRARDVAQAAGGILGLGGKISKSEQAVLSDLEATLS